MMNMISRSVDESCNYGWIFGHFREPFIGKENQSVEWKSAPFDASSYQRCFSLTTDVFDFKSPEKSGRQNPRSTQRLWQEDQRILGGGIYLCFLSACNHIQDTVLGFQDVLEC